MITPSLFTSTESETHPLTKPSEPVVRTVPCHQWVIFQKRALGVPFCEMRHAYHRRGRHVTAGDNRPQLRRPCNMPLTFLRGMPYASQKKTTTKLKPALHSHEHFPVSCGLHTWGWG